MNVLSSLKASLSGPHTHPFPYNDAVSSVGLLPRCSKTLSTADLENSDVPRFSSAGGGHNYVFWSSFNNCSRAMDAEAAVLMAANDGWQLDATNTAGVIFTALCIMVRFLLLREVWSRKQARPQKYAALADELDSFQHVFRKSVELNAAYMAQKSTSGPTEPVAGHDDTGLAPGSSNAAGFKED
ncbi:hypothetical protein VOLCADRAFT_95498 [Volvox carteri f. nagariensis]|uniref:Uncharacterized protein n=1 Tax=Volvox carteri f. nagariensis TaxID=3068 RepID=D8U7M3_VOLCA|nr:uncharacterized protein VOLCADRAFT_95498 [Volvox carteri f. nagariensis]EFJ44259.1 hypothetical protein VOLCADRAFT_95498 [Volvox carteri f. nagariensis]|eukprot:XP_002954618.1 hypothetical protein VOLCADRAFT_95498 [Volvox carteri f. nagariensis]